jgi:ketosteroid isomerase-like protein
MSQENVELVREMIGWFNTEDVEAAQTHSTDDVEIVPLRAALEDTSYRGPQAFASFLADNQEAWEELQFDPEMICDAGVRVVAIGNVSAHARGTGAPVTARVACSSSSEATSSRDFKRTRKSTKPSKPPGCGSRRCRRRTWR